MLYITHKIGGGGEFFTGIGKEIRNALTKLFTGYRVLKTRVFREEIGKK